MKNNMGIERKIGEVFKHKNKWYQCVECDSCGECSLFATECGSGTKSDLADEIFGECSKARRTDNKHVIFKRLKKIGKPFIIGTRIFQKYNLFEKSCIFNEPYYSIHYDDDSIGIELKRTKILTVQDLIDELTKIKDKSKKVILDNPYSDKNYFEIDEVEDFDEYVTIWYK